MATLEKKLQVSRTQLEIMQNKAEIRRLKRENRRIQLYFGQFVLALYTFACVVWITADYVLAFLNHTNIQATVTVTIIGSVVAALISYYAKSYKEKDSRNRHKVDENGVPYDLSTNNDKEDEDA